MPRQMLKNHHLRDETPHFSPLLLLLLSMACHSIKYPPGHFKSAVPAVSLLSSCPPQPSVGKALKLCKHHPETGITLVCYQHSQSHKSQTAPVQLLLRVPARSSTWYTHPKMWTLLCPLLWASFMRSAHCSGHAQHQTRSTTTTGTSSDCSSPSFHRESSLQSIFFAVLWMRSPRSIILTINKYSVSQNDRNWCHRPEEDEDGFPVGHSINLFIIV